MRRPQALNMFLLVNSFVFSSFLLYIIASILIILRSYPD